MLVVLVSCDVNNNTNGNVEEEAQPDVELEIGVLVDTFEKALEAYSWFDHMCMPTSSSEVSDPIEADGMVYYEVKHDTIKTYADLETYLRSLFAGDIVERLLDRGLYRDFDGVLYTVPFARGHHLFKGGYSLNFERVSEEKVICIVEVELLDADDLETVKGFETHEYHLELVDGDWIFTNFDLFY